MGKLDGKVAIVTGAARGLGRAYARRLAGLGAKIAVADLNLRSYQEFEAEAKDMTADSTVAEIEAAGGEAIGIELDVTDREAVEAMVAQVVARWGRVDVLVANAGGGRGRPMDTKASGLDPALLQLVVAMNLFGTVYSCNAVAPIMKQQRSGKIVTVSSVAGTAASADGGYAHYGAAKAAIAHYTRYLAQDLGPFGITANCIAPGVIATGRIMQTVIPGSSQSNRDRSELVALRRLGTVEDCAKVSTHLTHLFAVESILYERLEVSSPGLDRKLVKAADFTRFTGSRLKLTTRQPVNDNRHFEGRLESFENDRLTLDLSVASHKSRKKMGDEARNLPRVVDSVRGLASEIIVVDTGSTDDTVRIARRLGARVEHLAWDDDFAAGRSACSPARSSKRRLTSIARIRGCATATAAASSGRAR